MFKAKVLNDNTIINLKSKYWSNKRESLKKMNRNQGFVCQSCLKKVVLAWAANPKTAPHFRHNPKNIDCDQNDESIEHAKGKELIYQYFIKKYKDIAEEIDIEHHIPQTGQIADVYIKFKNGQEWAIEYQRSNMSLDTLIRRRELYAKANIRDIWIVGENLAKIQKDDSVSFKRISQELISDTSFGKNCILSLNPTTMKVGIYRNISKINSRKYRSYMHFYDLENIEFNLIGEPFGYRDVIDFKGISYNFVHRTSLTITNISLQKSNIPTYKFLAVQEDNGQFDKTYMNIPDNLMKFIPKTCSNIDCQVEFVYSHKDISKVGQFFPVKISSSSWRNKLDEKKFEKINEIDFTRWWYPIFLLYSMATMENKYAWLESAVPFVRQRRTLYDKKIIEHLYEPTDKVELIPLMTAVMRILKVQPEDVLQEALDRDFINNTEEEITNIFMLELMRKVEVICVERFNALGKGRIEIMF
ncbi:competence protein CoiA [Brevibacillus halotolerans]|uniref:competence protein CoiA n=1 Tax=Brevibacillus TaxID=55080 RepID=UPI00215BA8CB|nr:MULTISPECIES: competence protein CoiA [Brevibacillus]MCR8964121.1 competence protein CoiA [Brevibacillus laterosporus]MCZ0836276.1 competence protein CoiA [Brevibacillus halotolerans]